MKIESKENKINGDVLVYVELWISNITYYFISHGSKFRGCPLTTLPVVFNKDITRVSDDKLQITSLKDLEHLRYVAQNRQTWRKLTTRIREAAEASPSDD